MTEIELLIDLHKDAKRQGPGGEEQTKRALELTTIDANEKLKVADIGCGSGAQTITLAQNTQATITAVDLFPEFLEKLEQNAEDLGLKERIVTRKESMEELSFGAEEFDLIWSEGAIYNMGFERGVKEWKRFLKKGGYLAVSEISWLTASRPQELTTYWEAAYREIDAISAKIGVLEQHGYAPVGHFVLPPKCWLNHYYTPMQERFEAFLQKHNNSKQARALVVEEKKEMELYQKYQEYYSYVFYIAQKI